MARHARPRSKNRLIIAALVALLLVAAGKRVALALLRRIRVDRRRAGGRSIPPRSVRVFLVYVINVNVGDNQYVEKGTVLVEIDPKDYQVAVDKAKADLASAEATAQSLNIGVPIASVNTSSQLSSAASDIDSATAGIVAAEKQLAAARAQVDQAEANNVRAQDDLRRYKQLVDKQNVSEQIYDQSLAAARASTANVAAAHANESAAEQAILQAKSRLSQAEANHRSAQTGPQQVASTRARALSAVADVQQRRAALEQAQLNLQYTKVMAPVSGQVNKTVVVGMNVQPGQILMNLVPLDEIWITANFKRLSSDTCGPARKLSLRSTRAVADTKGISTVLPGPQVHCLARSRRRMLPAITSKWFSAFR